MVDAARATVMLAPARVTDDFVRVALRPPDTGAGTVAARVTPRDAVDAAMGARVDARPVRVVVVFVPDLPAVPVGNTVRG